MHSPDDNTQGTLLRGRRVPIDEIERVLSQHASVRQAAVSVRQVEAQEHLIAYIVADGAPDHDQLRSHLRQHLPADAVPSAFVSVDALPRTAAGAGDREALPPFQAAWSLVSRTYVAPRNAAESTLAAIWAEVLLVERVGIHDDFLELGGDSLLASHVVARTFERLGIEIPIESLFERGTIAELMDDYFGGVKAQAGQD
jgi:acyl carrier protein